MYYKLPKSYVAEIRLHKVSVFEMPYIHSRRQFI